MRIVISSGHGKYVRGASGLIDEVDEARRVVGRVTDLLREAGHHVEEFHDDVSTSQDENLHRIVDFHNAAERQLDVSVHFNAYVPTTSGRGCEVLYVTQDELAEEMSAAIAAAGLLTDRGAHYRSDLFFLNQTEEPAILIEVCFVDSALDVQHYQTHFDAICQAIAGVAEDEGGDGEELPPSGERPVRPPAGALFTASGACSWFGGPDDTGVDPGEGLAFLSAYEQAPQLFLNAQPQGTTGLARRLNPAVYYIACRWDYDQTPKSMLADPTLLAMVSAGGRAFLAWPADWGPHENTGRIADLSPGLMDALQLTTDDDVEVVYPATGKALDDPGNLSP